MRESKGIFPTSNNIRLGLYLNDYIMSNTIVSFYLLSGVYDTRTAFILRTPDDELSSFNITKRPNSLVLST